MPAGMLVRLNFADRPLGPGAADAATALGVCRAQAAEPFNPS
jgi:hypothetical protein